MPSQFRFGHKAHTYSRPYHVVSFLSAGAIAIGIAGVGILTGGVGGQPAQAAPQPTTIPPSAYSLIGFSSQSPAYPAPPALDGTAAAIFDNDPTTAWTSAFDNNGATGPFPHYLAFDLGQSYDLTALQYEMKSGNGFVKDYKIFVSNDPNTLKDCSLSAAPNTACGNSTTWGNPVATGTFTDSTKTDTLLDAPLDSQVTGEFVKFEIDSSYNDNSVAAASEIRMVAMEEPAAPPAAATPVALTAGNTTVTVAKEFPQVIQTTVGGKTLPGQPNALNTWKINGKNYTSTTTIDTSTASSKYVTYTSTVPNLDNLAIHTVLGITAPGTVMFGITSITGSYEPKVNTIGIPNHSLVAVDSSSPGANLARTSIDTDSTKNADVFIDLTKNPPADASPVGSPYAFVADSNLSAGVYSNATLDTATDSTDQRLSTQIVSDGNGGVQAQLSSGSWVWHPALDPSLTSINPTIASIWAKNEVPTAILVVTGDTNGDGVSWQDAASTLRPFIARMTGQDPNNRVPERVIERIPFNIASEGTNPFLKSLDNTKRIALATDGLGQWVLEKGYTSEGHDSANSDYGDDFNEGAGGLADLNTEVNDSQKYNTDVAVHINTNGAYAAANSFSPAILQNPLALGWNWLNQEYSINLRADVQSGSFYSRLQQLKNAVPNLASIYNDAYYAYGWLPEINADIIHSFGWDLASEWAYAYEGNSMWSHWANDKNYGGADNKGINSGIARFINNTTSDVWNTDPLLGGSILKAFEGWTAENDYNAFYQGIWTDSLPTKYLQHFTLNAWNPGVSATFDGGVSAHMDNGTRVIDQGGAEVLRGSTYLLPWGDDATNAATSSPLSPTKMYFYSQNGVSGQTFTLTSPFANITSFTQYKLTDQGRVKVADITPTGGKITVTGAAGQPYVIVPAGNQTPVPTVAYGTGTNVVDPGFNTGNLSAWNPTGGASVSQNTVGDYVANLGTSGASSISQTVTGLTPGTTYAFLPQVQIGPNAARLVNITVTGSGVNAVNAFDSSPAPNSVGSDSKMWTGDGSYFQVAPVQFTAPANGTVTLSVKAVAGTDSVTLDDMRLEAVKDLPANGGSTPIPAPYPIPSDAIQSWNFENNIPGYGPFVRGTASSLSDAQTSLSVLHTPYTQQGWKNANIPYSTGAVKGTAVDDVLSGTRSLKSHDESNGLLYRTVPSTVNFIQGHAYKVSFDYQATASGIFTWDLGSDDITTMNETAIIQTPLKQALTTQRFTQQFTATCGSDSFVGLEKVAGTGPSDFILDDFAVEDLGPSTTEEACATTSGANTTFNRGTPNEFVTSFTNLESGPATNVVMTLPNLPTGWKITTLTNGGNHFDSVAPLQTVTTTWLATPPADATPGPVTIGIDSTYSFDCQKKVKSGSATASLSERPMVPLSQMTATASSEQLGVGSSEGPAQLAIDGDPSTFWHTDWTAQPFPFTLDLQLGGTFQVDGFGYMDRQDGQQNGEIKDYKIFTSTDGGAHWTQAAAGTFAADSPDMQTVDFSAVTANAVRLESDSSQNDAGFASAAEVRVYGSGGVPDTAGFTPVVRDDTEASGCTAPQRHTVTFAVNGGSAVPSVTVNDGSPVSKPADPTRNGYIFAGWYTDSALAHAYDFSTPVKGDFTLYARWTTTAVTPPVTPPTSPPTGPNAPGCTVPNGNGHSEVNAAFSAKTGNTLITGTHDCTPSVYAKFQTDGNFVLYESTGTGTMIVLWAAGTNGRAIGGWLRIQSDGNVVIYNAAGHPVWASNTRFAALGGASGWLSVQSDGNMVMYYDEHTTPMWATGTHIL